MASIKVENSVLKYENYTIWHSGNFDTENINAKTFEGMSASAFRPLISKEVDLTNLDENMYYPVTISLGSMSRK